MSDSIDKKEFWEVKEDLEKYHGFQEFKIGCHVPNPKAIAQEAMKRGELNGSIKQLAMIIESIVEYSKRQIQKVGAESPEAVTIAHVCTEMTAMLKVGLDHMVEARKKYDAPNQES